MEKQMLKPVGGDGWKPELTQPGTATPSFLTQNIFHVLKEVALASPWLQGEELTGSNLERGHQKKRKSF